jgi:hypothetical protein
VFIDGVFLHPPGNIWYDLGQEAQRPQIFDNIRGFGGHQQEIEIVFQRLIDISDSIGFHIGVLLGMTDKFGKGSQETLHAQSVHLHKLARDEGFALSSANGCGQDHLEQEIGGKGSKSVNEVLQNKLKQRGEKHVEPVSSEVFQYC